MTEHEHESEIRATFARCDSLAAENEQLRIDDAARLNALADLAAENERLRKANEHWHLRVQTFNTEKDALTEKRELAAAENERLREQVEHLSQFARCSKDQHDGIAHGGASICQQCANLVESQRDQLLEACRHLSSDSPPDDWHTWTPGVTWLGYGEPNDKTYVPKPDTGSPNEMEEHGIQVGKWIIAVQLRAAIAADEKGETPDAPVGLARARMRGGAA